MTHDPSKYMPDVKKVLEECDPATFEQRQRKALTRAHEAGFIDRLTPEPLRVPAPEPAPEPQRVARVSGSSPWAKDGAGGIDKAALPSAMAPDGSERPVTKAVPEKAATAHGSQSWKIVLACAVACVCVTLVVVLAPRKEPKGAATQEAAGPSATAAGTASATTATPSAAAPNVATAAASVSATAPPSASPGTATAQRKKPIELHVSPPDAGSNAVDHKPDDMPRPPSEPNNRAQDPGLNE